MATSLGSFSLRTRKRRSCEQLRLKLLCASSLFLSSPRGRPNVMAVCVCPASGGTTLITFSKEVAGADRKWCNGDRMMWVNTTIMPTEVMTKLFLSHDD